MYKRQTPGSGKSGTSTTSRSNASRAVPVTASVTRSLALRARLPGRLLPVGALLYAGVVTLGSGALKDLALALFVGMAAGAYSSIFIATPLLVQLKMREPAIQRGDARATTRARHHEVDRYAAVPVFTDDMPVHDEPTGDDRDEDEDEVAPSAVGSGRPPRYTAGERPASRAVSNSASAKRAQPSRKPRSQRGKK